MVWDRPPEDIFGQGYDEWVDAIEQAVKLLADRFAADIEQWMKQNAVWTDRTGNLRQSMYAQVTHFVHESVEILFDYGLEYGFWLEFANQGRFAIIAPALDHFGPLWLEALRELLGN